MVLYVLAIAVSSFTYIAMAGLVTSLHKCPEYSTTTHRIVLIALGVT